MRPNCSIFNEATSYCHKPDQSFVRIDVRPALRRLPMADGWTRQKMTYNFISAKAIMSVLVTDLVMDLAQARERMVVEQLERRGIRDPRVLTAMRMVERDRFISTEYAAHAYDDEPLPIGAEQTISQPYMVALMC